MFKLIKKLIKWSLISFAALTAIGVVLALTTEPLTPEQRAANEQARIERAAEREAADAAREAAEQAEQAERERVAAERERVAAEREAERRRKGFHCLRDWDGSHRGITRYLERNLKDPDSYEHIETRVMPVNDNGLHFLITQYRAKNSFGGYVVDTISAMYRNSDCSVVEIVTQ